MIAGCSGVPRGGGAAGQGISEGRSSSRAPTIQYDPPPQPPPAVAWSGAGKRARKGPSSMRVVRTNPSLIICRADAR